MRSWAHSFSPHFDRTWTGSGVGKLCFGSLVARKGDGHLMLPGAPDGKIAVPQESFSLEHKKFTLLQWHSWEDLIGVWVFWVVRETSHGRGCPLLPWGLGHLSKVWLSWKPWKPGKDGGWGFHHPNRSSIFSFISSCLKLPEAPSKFLETEAVPRLVPQSCHLSDSDEHSQESWSPELCQTFRGIESRTRILREKRA